jgi:hypothetical protein
MGLRRTNLLRLLRPAMFLAAIRAKREGHRQGTTQGDPWQLGGTIVVGPGDRVIYAYRDCSPQDEAPLEQVLAALGQSRGLAPP